MDEEVKRKRRRPTVSVSAKKRRKSETTKQRNKSRIFIGSEITRWNKVKEEMGLELNSQVATFLLNSYEKNVKAVKIHSTEFKPQPSTSTPGMSGVTPGHRIVTRGLTDVSEISSEELASGSGLSGIMELSPKKTSTRPVPQSQLLSAAGTRKRSATQQLSSSFLDPFQLTLDITAESEEDEEDEYSSLYEPSIDATIGPKNINHLDNVSLADMEFGIEDSGDEEDETNEEESGGPGVFRIREQPDLYHLTKDSHVKEHVVHKWCSQPVLNRGLHGGDLMCATAIISSGNNFAKIALFARFLKLSFLNSSTYVRIQRTYLVPSIKELWQQKQEETMQTFKEKEIVVLGDGRMDSPGFNALYCSYTAMDNETKKILTVVSLDKREAEGKSTNMEKIAFRKVMEELNQKTKVTEVVTDAHLGIGAMMKKDFPDITHSHDIWHAAKNLGKKISAAATGKGCKPLQKWSSHITRHFWYCCQEATTYDDFMGLWGATLHHVVNEHEWGLGYGDIDYGQCKHGPLPEEERDQEWLQKGSPAHDALRRIIFANRFLNQVHYYLNFRSTAE